jgi:hypothetical protein
MQHCAVDNVRRNFQVAGTLTSRHGGCLRPLRRAHGRHNPAYFQDKRGPALRLVTLPAVRPMRDSRLSPNEVQPHPRRGGASCQSANLCGPVVCDMTLTAELGRRPRSLASLPDCHTTSAAACCTCPVRHLVPQMHGAHTRATAARRRCGCVAAQAARATGRARRLPHDLSRRAPHPPGPPPRSTNAWPHTRATAARRRYGCVAA